MRKFKRSAQNTIGSGCFSFIKKSNRKAVRFFTKSAIKVDFLKHLGLALSEPEWVMVDCGGTTIGYYMLEVKRLSTFEFRDPENFSCSMTAGLPDEVIDEMYYFQSLCIRKVRQLHHLDLNEFPVLRPAIEFLMEVLPYDAPVYDDMHNENFLLDKSTNTVIPYDVFNLESMESYQ